METTFSSAPVKGTIGYHAAINRPSRSKAAACETSKRPSRAAALWACLESIARNRDLVRVKPTDTITTYQWEATGDGSWQCNIMDIGKNSETVTYAAACAAEAARQLAAMGEPVPSLIQAAIDSGRLTICRVG